MKEEDLVNFKFFGGPLGFGVFQEQVKLKYKTYYFLTCRSITKQLINKVRKETEWKKEMSALDNSNIIEGARVSSFRMVAMRYGGVS